MSDTSKYGSSLTKLSALSPASKWIVSWFTKLSFPAVREEFLLDKLVEITISSPAISLQEIATDWISLQETLGVKCGVIPIKVVKILSNLLPIETRDPLKTLTDLCLPEC